MTTPSRTIAGARLDALMRAAEHGIVFVSEESAFSQLNAEASRILALPAGEIETAAVVAAMRSLQRNLRNAEAVAAEFARLLAQPDASVRDWIWEFTDAVVTTLRVSSVPTDELSGRGRLWLFDDVTAERSLRRELEQQHERERRHEQQQLEALTRLTAGIAHDFSNLLTVIGGSAEMLHESPDDALHASTRRVAHDRDSDLHAIRQATQRANTLIRQLLSFAGRAYATPELLELDAVLRRYAAGLSATLDDPSQLTVRPGAPGAQVLIDERQLSLALMNLVANAREHVRDGATIAVRSTCVRALAGTDARSGHWEGRFVAITVGVADAPHPATVTDDLRVPFAQTSASGARNELGLWIVAALAEQGGGTIRYAHADGAATQYVLYLPEADTHTATTRQMTPAIGIASVNETAAPMLVVDDDAGPRRVMRRLLEREGYAVLTAESAVDALRQLESREGQVMGVISDYLMPGMNGMELLTQVRARWSGLPVVLVSGFTYDDVTTGALSKLGAQFLPKPFTREELLASIRAAAATGVSTREGS